MESPKTVATSRFLLQNRTENRPCEAPEDPNRDFRRPGVPASRVRALDEHSMFCAMVQHPSARRPAQERGQPTRPCWTHRNVKTRQPPILAMTGWAATSLQDRPSPAAHPSGRSMPPSTLVYWKGWQKIHPLPLKTASGSTRTPFSIRQVVTNNDRSTNRINHRR